MTSFFFFGDNWNQKEHVRSAKCGSRVSDQTRRSVCGVDLILLPFAEVVCSHIHHHVKLTLPQDIIDFLS